MSHQGATLFRAGSWVGASALVRRAALDDIVVTVEERGFQVPVYVRDRTLNEDTDTTVDLIRKNWTVYNYPDRFAYSATPSDFGSLLIQRRRWATGGLIILPNMVRYFLDSPSFVRMWEGLIRAMYILSAPLGSLGFVVLMVYPFFEANTVFCVWSLPALFVYVVTFGRDLMHNGTRTTDLFKAMALSAMLIPINIAGAINSIGQIWTGRKIPFQRTPKVQGRMAAPAIYVAAEFALLLFVVVQVLIRIVAGEWPVCLFFLYYVGAFGYSLYAFIGLRAAIEDLHGNIEPQLRLVWKQLVDAVPSFDKSHVAQNGTFPMKTKVRSTLNARLRRFVTLHARRHSRLLAAVTCTCVLLTSLTITMDAQESGSSAMPVRKVAITLDDLPVISVTQLDSAGRRDITTTRVLPISGCFFEL